MLLTSRHVSRITKLVASTGYMLPVTPLTHDVPVSTSDVSMFTPSVPSFTSDNLEQTSDHKVSSPNVSDNTSDVPKETLTSIQVSTSDVSVSSSDLEENPSSVTELEAASLAQISPPGNTERKVNHDSIFVKFTTKYLNRCSAHIKRNGRKLQQ